MFTKRMTRIVLSIIIICTIFFLPATAFAAGTCAFSVGTNYGLFNVDTSSDATTAGKCYSTAGYNTYTFTVPTVNIMTGTLGNGTKSIQSDILFFSGHGNYDNISFRHKGRDGEYKTGVYYGRNLNDDAGYKYVGIAGNMSTVKLATFAGCNTASNNNSNLPARAVLGGADTAVGWSSSVSDGSHTNWLSRYNNKLASGSTVLQAVNYANSFNYLDNNVKDACIYGNQHQVIKLRSSFGLLDEELRQNKKVFKYGIDILENGSLSVRMIEAAIKNTYPEFNALKYNSSIHKICEGCYTIDFIFMINNIETNSCYTATIIENKLVEIVNNAKNMDELMTKNIEGFNCNSIQSTENSVLNMARKATEESELKRVDKQDSKYYYDAITGKLELVVFTTYFWDGTEAIGKDMYIQTIR